MERLIIISAIKLLIFLIETKPKLLPFPPPFPIPSRITGVTHVLRFSMKLLPKFIMKSFVRLLPPTPHLFSVEEIKKRT